jgi:hypothetical protein
MAYNVQNQTCTQTDSFYSNGFSPKTQIVFVWIDAVLKLYRIVCYIIKCGQDWNGIIQFTRDLQNMHSLLISGLTCSSNSLCMFLNS